MSKNEKKKFKKYQYEGISYMEVNIRRNANWIESSCFWETGNNRASMQPGICNLYTCTRLIKKLVQVFLCDFTENPNELFRQSNITANKKDIFKRV